MSLRSKIGAGALAAIALISLGAARTSSHRVRSPARALASAPTPAPAASVTVSARPGQIGRLSLGVPTGARLLMAGRNALADIDLDSGSSTGIGLPGPVRRVLRVGAGAVVLLEPPASGQDGANVFFVSRGGTTIAPLGFARSIVAAARDDAVWLADPVQGAPPGHLEEVDLSGHVLETTELGPHRSAIRETSAGMLTSLDKYFSRSLDLWNWHTHTVLKTYFVGRDVVVADADGRHAAYTVPGCVPSSCRLRVVSIDAAGVTEIDVDTPAGWSTELAAFSPDGRQIAVLGRMRKEDASSSPAFLIADVRTGAAVPIGGLDTFDDRYARVTWSADGRWLFAVPSRVGGPLFGYHLDDSGGRLVADPRGPDATAAGAPVALVAY